MVLPAYLVNKVTFLESKNYYMRILMLFVLASLLAFEGCNTANRGKKTERIPTLKEVTDVLIDSTATFE